MYAITGGAGEHEREGVFLNPVFLRFFHRFKGGS